MSAETFGHYEVLEPIGSGGMGVVYRARDVRLGREVAIKVLRQDAWTAPARDRLLREARAISALNHPHICTVHDIGDRDGETFIVMELVPGTPLTLRLRQEGLEPETVVRWGAQLADALDHAHAQGVIHRDLKPGNVVVTPAGRVKLLDFGIAARGPIAAVDTTVLETAEDDERGVAGTPPYMAPEVLRGMPADARSDIWSLGVLLHEALAGERPFDLPTRDETAAAILRDAPRPLPGHVPPALAAVVRRCLAKDPAARYQRAGEVRAALEAIQPGTSGAHVPHRALNVGLIAVIVALAAASAIALFYAGSPANWLTGLTGAARAPDAMPEIRGIAVLPLRNLGGDAQDFFADGMTSALITELAKVDALKVISQTSIMRYRDRADRTAPEIGTELGVDAIVEGSVLRVDDRVRISVDLVHAGSDRHLWAESYERPLRDVLALQEEIAREVVSHVQSRVAAVDPGTRRTLADPEAYELFLRGEISLAQANPVGVNRAIDYYERAIARDTSFAPAYAGLAGALFAQEFWGTAPFQANVARVRPLVDRALALDPDLADAHVMKARLLFNYDWDWAGCEAALKRALDLAPGNPFAHETYGWLLLGLGRRDEALSAARTAASLDPRSAYMAFTEARVLHRARHFAQAEAAYQRSLDLDPGFPRAYAIFAQLYTNIGRLDAARALLERRDRLPLVRRVDAPRAVLTAAAGDERQARELAATLDGSGQARVFAVLGDREAAFAALERAIADRTFLAAQWTDVELDVLRPDPRFAQLVARMGLDPEPLVSWGRPPGNR